MLVPVANPNTEDNLLRLALILAKTTGGTLLPLHILTDHQGRIPAEAKAQQVQLLTAAEAIAHAAVTAVEPIGRVDDSIDKGILRTAQERDANLIICGWKGFSTYQDNFFGSTIDNVVRRSTMPVLIARFTHPIATTKRVFLAIPETEPTSVAFQQTLALSRTLAAELKASLRILQVTSDTRRFSTNGELSLKDLDIPIRRIRGNFTSSVSRILTMDDLLILIHDANSVLPGLPTLGVAPEAIARNRKQISLIVAHFPYTH